MNISESISEAEKYFNENIKTKKQRSKLYDYKDELLHLRKLGASFDDIVIYLKEKRGYSTTKRSVHFFLTKISSDEKVRISKRKKRSDSNVGRNGANNSQVVSSDCQVSSNQVSTSGKSAQAVSTNLQVSGKHYKEPGNQVSSFRQDASSDINMLLHQCQAAYDALDSYKPMIDLAKQLEGIVIGSYANKFTAIVEMDENNRNFGRDAGRLKKFTGDTKIELLHSDIYKKDALNIELNSVLISSLVDHAVPRELKSGLITKRAYDINKISSEAKSIINHHLNLYFCGDIVKQEYLREHLLFNNLSDIGYYTSGIYEFDRQFQRFIDTSTGTECIHIVFVGLIKSSEQDIYFFDYMPDEETLNSIVDRSTQYLQESKQIIVFPLKIDKDRLVFDTALWDGNKLDDFTGWLEPTS